MRLLALLLLAAALRLWAWANTSMMMNDGPDFLWQAERMRQGEILLALQHPYHPGYAAATAALSYVCGDLLSAAVAASVLGGVLLVTAVWLAARVLFPDDENAALLAGLVAALHSRAIIAASDVQSDGLFIGLFALSGALAFVGGKTRALLGGLLAGAAYATRPEGLFLLLPAALSARRQRSISCFLLFLAGLAVAALPYALALRELSGRWTLSMKPSWAAVGLASSEQQPLPLPPDSPMGWPIVNSEIEEAPVAAIGEQSLVLLDLYETLHPSGLILFVPGMIVLWRRRRPMALALLGLSTLFLLACLLHASTSGYISKRHLLVPLALLLPVSGAGVLAFWRHGILLRLLLLATLLNLGVMGVKPRRDERAGELEALAWVSEHTPPDGTFAAHRRREGYYAGRRAITVGLPAPDQELLDAMRRWEARYLMIALDELEEHEPGWLAPGMFTEAARFGEPPILVLELPQAALR